MGQEGDLAVLLLDLALFEERQPGGGGGLDPQSLLVQILAFSNAYAMLHKHNSLTVYAGGHDFCRLVHLSQGEDAEDSSVFPSAALHSKLSELAPHAAAAAERARSPGGGGGFALSAMLSRALCLIHRLQGGPQAASQRKPRIICVVGSPDVPMQYIPVMNAIFSAQRANVVIDALVLTPPPSPGRADHPSAAAAAPVAGMSGAAVVPSPPSSSGPDSSFLQQATHLTGGLYFKPADGEALLPYLLNYLAVDTQTRGMLDVPQALGVDFRASCFCHKRTIDVGYVCSVCLSIFCQPHRDCSTCGTQFAPAAAAFDGPAAAPKHHHHGHHHHHHHSGAGGGGGGGSAQAGS